jgi:exonuclease III
MRIVAWNIWWGGGSRSNVIAEEVIARAPEVLILSEYQPIASASLIATLRERGWVHQELTTPPGRYGGVAILSKSTIERQAVPASMVSFEHRYLSVRLPQHDIEIRAIYAPLHKDPFAEFWAAALTDLEESRSRPVLVIGDFNSGESRVDSPAAADIFCAEYFAQIPSRGYSDIWRSRHGPDAREYTWLGPVNPYRLDHAFGTESLARRVSDCAYDHSVRVANYSDHSLLWLDVN